MGVYKTMVCEAGRVVGLLKVDTDTLLTANSDQSSGV